MADKTVASLTSSTPTIDDLTISYDNADTSELKKTTWQLVRDLFKTYFDTIYQAVLVSWTNIKTVNSQSLLGSGDIVISGGSGTLDWLTDVTITTPTNWQIIAYETASSQWKNVTLSGGGDMLASTYDPAWIAQQVAGLTATQTFSTGVKTFLAGMFGLRNVANTFTSFFTNTNTASRTYTLKDANGTLAFTTDITGTNSGTNTGDQTSIVGITGTKAQFDTACTDWDFATLAGTETLTNKTLTTPAIASIKWTLTADTDWATITFNKNTSDFHSVTLGWNRTLALSNMATGDRIVLRLQQDWTWTRTVTWFTTIKWVWGTVPTLTTTINKADTFWFLCTSAWNYDGFIIWQNI